MTVNNKTWIWLFVAASVIWLVSAIVVQRNADIDSAEKLAELSFQSCETYNSIRRDGVKEPCDERRDKLRASMSGMKSSVIEAALPVVLYLFCGFVLFYVARALYIGLGIVINWRELSIFRRVLVSLVAVFSALLLCLAALVGLGSMVTNKVPVALGYRASVSSVAVDGSGLVTAEGTWVIKSNVRVNGNYSAFPLQTSKIECWKHKRQCVEAKAYIFPGNKNNTLVADLITYEIESWSPTAIVMYENGACARDVITIDLITKTVNGVMQPAGDEYCKKNREGDAKSFRLEDGYTVWSQEREKAYPLPLRLLSAFFGGS